MLCRVRGFCLQSARDPGSCCGAAREPSIARPLSSSGRLLLVVSLPPGPFVPNTLGFHATRCCCCGVVVFTRNRRGVAVDRINCKINSTVWADSSDFRVFLLSFSFSFSVSASFLLDRLSSPFFGFSVLLLPRFGPSSSCLSFHAAGAVPADAAAAVVVSRGAVREYTDRQDEGERDGAGWERRRVGGDGDAMTEDRGERRMMFRREGV